MPGTHTLTRTSKLSRFIPAFSTSSPPMSTKAPVHTIAAVRSNSSGSSSTSAGPNTSEHTSAVVHTSTDALPPLLPLIPQASAL
mmetsp:Transcript_19181/g.53704  ORF Transcript_19181/g.53704 Transcript_19181/m.53704 type:complete len:84 (+) Transcript_19181:354-605(+)